MIERRNCRLRLQRLSRPFRFLPAARRHHDRPANRENSFDIRATSRLNRLYVELLKDNPEWGTSARRHDMNHFMARLIFCFFAEDTDIFIGKGLVHRHHRADERERFVQHPCR